MGCAVIALALCLYCLWAAPRPESSAAPPVRFAQMLGHSGLWLLGVVQMATFGLMIVVATWITTLLRLTLGMPLKTAGLLGSLVLLIGIVTRPLGGWLAHRMGMRARRHVFGAKRCRLHSACRDSLILAHICRHRWPCTGLRLALLRMLQPRRCAFSW